LSSQDFAAADPESTRPIDRDLRNPKRGLWIGVAAILGFCILGCVLVFVAGVPAFRNEVRDGIHDTFATEVARQIPTATGGVAQPGSYTLDAASLQAGLRENLEDDDEALIVRITSVQIEVGITSQGQDAFYTGSPIAEDGELEVQEMTTENGLVRFLLPPDTVAAAIEDPVNDYLAANNLRLDRLELGDGEMTLHVVAAE
jgi:hypothetical protein